MRLVKDLRIHWKFDAMEHTAISLQSKRIRAVWRLFKRKTRDLPVVFQLMLETFPNKAAKRAFLWLGGLSIAAPILDTIATAFSAKTLTNCLLEANTEKLKR